MRTFQHQVLLGIDERALFLRVAPPKHKYQALTLTVWEDEEAAAASDVTAERSRERTVAATGVELQSHGRYELVERA